MGPYVQINPPFEENSWNKVTLAKSVVSIFGIFLSLIKDIRSLNHRLAETLEQNQKLHYLQWMCNNLHFKVKRRWPITKWPTEICLFMNGDHGSHNNLALVNSAPISYTLFIGIDNNLNKSCDAFNYVCTMFRRAQDFVNEEIECRSILTHITKFSEKLKYKIHF